MEALVLMELTVTLAYVQEDSLDLIVKLNFLNATRNLVRMEVPVRISH